MKEDIDRMLKMAVLCAAMAFCLSVWGLIVWLFL
jgi:hypothetical protein